MSYEITKPEVLRDRMITWFAGIQQKVTDFIVGGKTYSKFEALAIELESMLYQVFQAITKAIPVAVYQTFSFTLLPAVKASGTVTFSANPAPVADVNIPAGTQISTDSGVLNKATVYATTSAAVLSAGQTSVQVAVSCTVAGKSGNVGSNTLTVLKTTISGITGVTNAAAISNGADIETEAQRKSRFIAFISTLTRGTNAALVYGAKTTALTDAGGNVTERVVDAKPVGPATSGQAGLLDLYIFNGSTGASANLIAAAQKIVDGDSTVTPPVAGYKAAGIVVTVKAVTTVPVNVTLTVIAKAEVDKVALKASVESVINVYLQSFGIAQPFLLNELVERVMGVEGVYDLTPTTPTANVTPTDTQVLVPGTVTVTVN